MSSSDQAPDEEQQYWSRGTTRPGQRPPSPRPTEDEQWLFISSNLEAIRRYLALNAFAVAVGWIGLILQGLAG